MKKIFALSVFLIAFNAIAQISNVNYTPATGAIPNPERGFYHHTETHSASYAALSQSVLNTYRSSANMNLILRVFYLEDFVNGPISSGYLTSMQSDFSKVRSAGLKCIVRFAYSDDNGSGLPQDATKSQVLAHIAQLKPILQANSDIIALVQAGFIGAWGEWYYTTNFGLSPTATDFANRREVLTSLISALPANRMVQLRTPALKRNTLGVQSAITSTQAFTSATTARVGHHNDCFLASSDDYGTYNNVTTEYPYLEQETKYVPMGGETCAVNAPRSKCMSAVEEMARFHWSFLNLDYHPNVISGFETDGCFNEIENRLGYRYELVSGAYPQSANIGGVMPVTISMRNSGFATIFNQRYAYLVLRNTATNAEYSVRLNTDARYWNSNATTNIVESVTLPTTMTAGTYKLFLNLPDSDPALGIRPEYSVHLANSGTWENTTGYNNLNATVTIGTSLAVGQNTLDENTLAVYPVPANDQLNLEMDGIEDFNVSIYNALGQNVGAPVRPAAANKTTVNTSALSTGVYFVSLQNGKQKITKMVIVTH